MADLGRPAEASSDSEWEYEYHETETESFFVTLDLPAVPSTKKRKRAEESADTPSTPNNAATQKPDPDTAPSEPFTPKANLTASPEPENRIQILGLHTREPVISYKNQVYTCQWTSTIGTDVLLTPPDSAIPLTPFYEAPGVNVLATSNIKLVGEPVQLVPRAKAARIPSLPFVASVSSVAATAQSPVARPTTAQADSTQPTPQPVPAPPAIPRRLAPSTGMSSVRQSQGRFLERLMELKAARGEQDQVILHHRHRPNDNGWKTWTDGGQRGRQRRVRNEAEEEEGLEENDSDSDEGWADDHADLEGLDEDDGLGSTVVDGPARTDAMDDTVATADIVNFAT